MIDLRADTVTLPTDAMRAAMAFAARTVRAVTHLDVGAEDCARAADVLAECVSGAR